MSLTASRSLIPMDVNVATNAAARSRAVIWSDPDYQKVNKFGHKIEWWNSKHQIWQHHPMVHSKHKLYLRHNINQGIDSSYLNGNSKKHENCVWENNIWTEDRFRKTLGLWRDHNRWWTDWSGRCWEEQRPRTWQRESRTAKQVLAAVKIILLHIILHRFIWSYHYHIIIISISYSIHRFMMIMHRYDHLIEIWYEWEFISHRLTDEGIRFEVKCICAKFSEKSTVYNSMQSILIRLLEFEILI